MDAVRLERTAGSFFDAFVEAFGRFEGDAIARLYRAPYLALYANGSARCFEIHDDIATYFQGVVDDYHRKGCRSCRHRDLEVVALGTRSLLASVTWDLLLEDGTPLSSWRESYTLASVGDALRVVASVDHAS